MSDAVVKLTPRLMRAGRAMAGWQQQELAAASRVPKPTISAFELKAETGKLTTKNNRALVEAFERAGLACIPENGGGAGIRFRDRRNAAPSK